MPGQNNTFYSQTDTEVLIKLVDYYYKKYRMGPIDTITKTMVRVRMTAAHRKRVFLSTRVTRRPFPIPP